ncbi:hypothetical protein Afil01_60500 [Actinorhabdospora filicis]|uniref:DUF3618 domain-containing protein n=1 Tax=Actinorhabdospora filicis TaxID=1785913 RepID=A0A9W6SRX4_9ACTN|nr:hypothetical protein [Actinorhabdospora filicis]GLZ81243.1 hypothetical protein Afil01_60500 [Actinorhabdospora filicis]
MKNRTQIVRDELGQSFGHFRTAATHAAQGAAEKIAPRVDSAMVAVGLRQRPKRRLWPWIAGAVGLGAVAGVTVIALVKRRQGQWEDYTATDAVDDLQEAGSDAVDKVKDVAADAKDKVKDHAAKAQDKAAELANKTRDKAADLADRAADKVRSATPSGYNSTH